MEIWKIIVQSNTFNFILMVLIFAWIIKASKLSQKLDDAVLKVKETIDNSTLAKEKSSEELKNANEETKNTQSEIKEIEDRAQENISNLEEKISKEAQNQADYIKKSADKVILAKEREVAASLSKKTVLASVEAARLHVIKLLENHPDYHQKFIKESIEELNRLN